MKEAVNALSFDVEEWYHRNDITFPESVLSAGPGRVADNLAVLLDILSAAGVKATFFVLGTVASSHPETVKMITCAGHEPACHGWDHSLVYTLSRDEFRNRTERAKKTIEDLSGQPVRGYRAPSWSVNGDVPWFPDELLGLGFTYDSSMIPVKYSIYGYPGSNPYLHQLGSGLIEFPPPTFILAGKRFPFAGASALRFLPYAAVKVLMRRFGGGNHPALVYLHPWEIDETFVPPELPYFSAMELEFKHIGIASARKKLESLLADFRFSSLSDVIGRYMGDER